MILPCVGSFTVPAAVAETGFPRDRIFTSDVSIYSSVIGYLLDPDKSVEQMGLEPSSEVICFVEDVSDEVDYVAGILVAIGWLQVPNKETRYHQNVRHEILANRSVYRAGVRQRLEALVEATGGIHYDDHDVRDVIAAAADDAGAFLYFNLPGFKFGYSKMFGDAEEAFGWGGVVVQEFLPEYSREVYESLVGKPITAVTYVSEGTSSDRVDDLPPKWVKIYANVTDRKKAGYLAANRELEIGVHARARDHEIQQFPIYNDEEITPDTQVAFVCVDGHTCLYYRDLFVHRLGAVASEQYFLMLLDGRVVTAMGLHLQHYHLQNSEVSDYIAETFGITKTSARYARLGKLFMLCLTSGDFKRFLMCTSPHMQFREPRGISTTSITVHPEGKTDRSVMKLALREKLDDGRFRLVYRADFRDDTWSEVLATWLRKWGDKRRE